MNKIRKTSARLNYPIVFSEELSVQQIMITCSAPIPVEKGNLEFVQSSKNIIGADSDDENEMNNAARAPKSSERRKVMKNMHSYLDAHSNGEMHNETDDID
ncbi:hypothetical protein TNCV_909461 [Trichonephila clavipes]|nr:hypothetical protein TNCV_909461 [Trichonephila clavipes]